MQWLRPGSEAEMVALFLRTELPSDRWRDDLQALRERAGVPERVVTDPDLDDEAENQARLRLLTQHRGYGTRTELFEGFPCDVCWWWMTITSAELARVRFIDYDYWSYPAAPAWRSTLPRASVRAWRRSGCPTTGC